MPDEPQPRRLFGDKEISSILKRATEIQEAEGPSDAYGLSLEELQQIAAEVGIDPQHVAAAIAELEGAAPAEKPFHLLGGPASIHLERVVEGEVTEEKGEAMLAEIRRAFDLVGTSGQVGRSLEWTHNGRQRQVQVAVTSREGQTKIRIHDHFPRTALVAFIPTTVLALQLAVILIGALGPASLLGWLLGLSIVATVLMVARFGFGALSRKRQRQGGDLLERLARIAAEPTPAPLLSSEKASLRLDADSLAGEEAEESRVQARRRGKTAS